VSRNEPPEDPGYYSEPTRAARAVYGGYRDAPPDPKPPPTPWYRTASALVAGGALAVILLGVLVFAVVKFATGSPTPTVATATPATSTTTTTSTSAAPVHHPPGGGAGTTVISQAPQTVTDTDTPTSTSTDTGTTTAPSTDTGTTTAPSTDTTTTAPSTITQTVTVTPSQRPFFLPPGGQ
jgi:hypothetical protein